MASKSKQTSTTEAKTEPFAPTLPLLEQILGKLGPQLDASGSINANEEQALSGLRDQLSQPSQFAPELSGLVSDLFQGGDFARPRQMIGQSNARTNEVLDPIARGAELDPRSNPFLSGVLSNVSDDITNRVRSQFAASGRDFSPAEQGTIARELGKVQTGALFDQFNRNRGDQFQALGLLDAAGLRNANALAGLSGQQTATRLQGAQLAPVAEAAGRPDFQGLLNLEAARRGIPINQLGNISDLLLPIASLGQQSTGKQTSVQKTPAINNILGGMLAIAGIASKAAGAAGGAS